MNKFLDLLALVLDKILTWIFVGFALFMLINVAQSIPWQCFLIGGIIVLWFWAMCRNEYRGWGMSCKCQECGKQYKVDLLIPDKLWEQIRPIYMSKSGGLLCGSCIMSKIEALDEYNYWFLKKEE